MRRFRSIAAVAVATLSVGAGSVALAPAATASGFSVQAACSAPAPGQAGCFALKVIGSARLTAATSGPSGYHPADLQSAYKLNPLKKGKGQKIAIVDAFDDPNAEADVAVYRSTFGLSACTTANGCFTKVNQLGTAAPLPATNVGWSEEISLDLDMASAVCPNCKLLLVEATTNSFANLAAAVNTAAASGATVISNSYGANEFAGETAYASFYNHPGIPITVSSGDSAYPAHAQFPADMTTVTAVGGTALKPATNARGWTESVWLTKLGTTAATSEGAGSGCSTVIAKPAWQHDTDCAMRTVADVSAVADPATGVAVYDTFGETGWLVFGGTSASAPIVAGVYALAGNGASINDASHAYANVKNLNDVKVGFNGNTCASSYLCTAKKGYDGPTGLGTPKGVGAF
jgi:subtilase family serine protease